MVETGSGTGARAPGRFWYLVAAAIFVAAAVAAGLLAMSQISKLGDTFLRVVAPGQSELDLTEAGSYSIFHEYNSVMGGQVYSSTNISGLQLALSAPGGETVELTPPGTTKSYALGGRAGIGLFDFDITEPGRYRLSTFYSDGRSEPRAVLSVGRGFVGAILSIVFSTLAIMFVGAGAAVAIAIRVFLKRRRARRPAQPVAA